VRHNRDGSTAHQITKPIVRTFGTREEDKKPITRPLAARHKNNEPTVRFVPLGGLEEIGANMMFFEYEDEIIAIDAGLLFPGDATPGIDYIIPNTQYLQENKDKVKALIITHAHYDHIGAIPHIIDKIGNPPIYCTSLSKALIEKRQEDYPALRKLKFVVIKDRDEIQLSPNFKALFFGVSHTIPESAGVVLQTPIGNILNMGDYKVEYDENGKASGLEELKEIGKMGIHSFYTDSTNADREGRQVTEKMVERNLEDIFKKAEGRIIVGSFASVITRIAEIIKIAEKIGRYVFLSGYSMKSNVQIAQNLGFIKAKSGTIVPIEELHKYKDDKVLILSTGAQGESNASFMKIINGEHRNIQVKTGDTVLFSASVIPGNERAVQTLKDNFARQGAIIFHSDIVDIHSSGHAMKDDIKLVMSLIKPKYLVPVHGYYYKRFINAQNAHEVGIKNTPIMDNGQVAELTRDNFVITQDTVPATYVFVDGLGVGDVEEEVLRDRISLSKEGMVLVVAAVDKQKGLLLKNPDIITRGFIYIRENQEMLEEMRKRIKNIFARLPNYREVETDYLKGVIRDNIGQYLFNKTRRRPMILTVLIEL
jgi:ribonuclease J